MSISDSLTPGRASAEGTARFAARFPAELALKFFRNAQGLTVSSLGIGTYLGEMDDATDQGYTEAVGAAVGLGVNFLDTSLNYRNQRSELSVGRAIRGMPRDEIVVCTKAGYLVKGAVPAGLNPDEISGGMHCMAPEFLDDQLERSRLNLGLACIDVFYLHNPETQLGPATSDQFYARIRRAFDFLEKAVSEGRIAYYGAATWDGFRRRPGGPEGLSIERLATLATEAGGLDHHFRFIQLPVNLAMPEAFAQRIDGKNVLMRAAHAGITVIASASLLQARLTRNLPEDLAAKLAGLQTDAQRALQFTRSTPGVTVALTGMSRVEHVTENARISSVSPLTPEQYSELYSQ